MQTLGSIGNVPGTVNAGNDNQHSLMDVCFPVTLTGADCLGPSPGCRWLRGPLLLLLSFHRGLGSSPHLSALLSQVSSPSEFDLLPCSLEGLWRILLQGLPGPPVSSGGFLLTCFSCGCAEPCTGEKGRWGFFLELYSLAAVHRTHRSSWSK